MTAIKLWVGIDPGLHGAIAAFYPDEIEKSCVHQLDTYKIKNKNQLDLIGIQEFFKTIICTRLEMSSDTHIILEEPHAMPRQGVTSSFKFGRVLGQLEGLISTYGVPYTLVSPATWKRHLGLTSDKDHTRQMASRLLPFLAHWWPKKSDHDKAEAMLLAYWGYLKNK